MAIDKPKDISEDFSSGIKEEIFADEQPDVVPEILVAPIAPTVSGYSQEDGSFHV